MSYLVDWDPIGDVSVNGGEVASSFCKHYRNENNNDWELIPNVSIIRSSAKAEYIRVTLFHCEDVNAGGIEMKFWCPEKLIKHDRKFESLYIPLWFLEAKVKECFR